MWTVPQVPTLVPDLAAELRALGERLRCRSALDAEDADIIQRTIVELAELRRQIAVLPDRTNLLMMSAAIASELAGTYESINDKKTQAHIALVSIQLALKLEELVPR